MRTLLLLIFSLILFPKDGIAVVISDYTERFDYFSPFVIVYENGKIVFYSYEKKSYYQKYISKNEIEKFIDITRNLKNLHYNKPLGACGHNYADFHFPRTKEVLRTSVDLNTKWMDLPDDQKKFFSFYNNLLSDTNGVIKPDSINIEFKETINENPKYIMVDSYFDKNKDQIIKKMSGSIRLTIPDAQNSLFVDSLNSQNFRSVLFRIDNNLYRINGWKCFYFWEDFTDSTFDSDYDKIKIRQNMLPLPIKNSD